MTLAYLTWLPAEPTAQELEQSISRGVIPILLPSENDRFVRWQKVLRWYGGREIDKTRLHRLPVRKPPSFRQHRFEPLEQCVVGVVHLLEQLDDAGAFPAGSFGHRGRVDTPIIAVGTGRCFTYDALEKANGLRCSVIAAVDVAGLYFLVSKLSLHLVSTRRPVIGFVGDLDGNVFYGESGGKGRRLPEQEASAVLMRSRRTLVIAAHGEGGHAKLGDTVVCGRIGNYERGPEGVIQGGCIGSSPSDYSANTLKCKRAPHETSNIVLFSDIRASEVVLLTCNGFSSAGQLYPSDVSAAMSLVDGYAASVLTTNSTMQFKTSIAGDLVRCWASNSEKAATLLCENHRGSSPGDAFSLLGGSRDLGKLFEALPRSRASSPAHGEATESPIQESNRAFLHLKQRFELAKMIIWRISTQVYRLCAREREQLDEYMLGIQPIFAVLDHSRDRERAKQIALQAAEMLIQGYILNSVRKMNQKADLRRVPDAMMDAFPVPLREYRQDSRCSWCRTRLRAREFGTGELYALRLLECICPVCGLSSVTITGDEIPWVGVEPSGLQQGGDPITVSIRAKSLSIEYPLLVVELSDKANGQTVSSVIVHPFAGGQITLDTPAAMSADIHTIRVLWCTGAHVGFSRVRAAFVRNPE